MLNSTSVGILTFISMKNTSESSAARKIIIFLSWSVKLNMKTVCITS